MAFNSASFPASVGDCGSQRCMDAVKQSFSRSLVGWNKCGSSLCHYIHDAGMILERSGKQPQTRSEDPMILLKCQSFQCTFGPCQSTVSSNPDLYKKTCRSYQGKCRNRRWLSDDSQCAQNKQSAHIYNPLIQNSARMRIFNFVYLSRQIVGF